MNRTEKILFALLRMALHGQPVTDIDWKVVTEQEWKEVYVVAAEQGVMALAWDGLQLVMGLCALPCSLKITWGLAVQAYEERYERYCRTAAELSAFYQEQGIGMVQLKGVGFSTYYPVPAHREGGDIDIYTYSLDKERRTDEEANELADELMRVQGIEVETDYFKHSSFYFQGIPIENHKYFIATENYMIAVPMNKLLHRLLTPVPADLCGGDYRVMVPPPAFNALFLSFHAAQHFALGFRIHHLFDWACLLKREGWCLPKEVTDEKLLDFICALTALCNRLLGTEVPVKGGEHLVGKVYEQMMHPRYSKKIPVKGRWAVLWYKWKRMLHGQKMLRLIFDVSVTKRVMHSVWFHLKKPKSIWK